MNNVLDNTTTNDDKLFNDAIADYQAEKIRKISEQNEAERLKEKTEPAKPEGSVGRLGGQLVEGTKEIIPGIAGGLRSTMTEAEIPNPENNIEIQKHYEKTMSPVEKSIYGTRMSELLESGVNIEDAKKQAIKEIYNDRVKSKTDFIDSMKSIEEAKLFERDKKYDISPKGMWGFAEKVARSLPSTGANLITTVISPPAGMAQMYLQIRGSVHQRLEQSLKNKYPEMSEKDIQDKASSMSNLSALIQTPMEALGNIVMIKNLLGTSGFKALAGEVLESVVGEGATEGLQQFSEELLVFMTLNPSLNKTELKEEFIKVLPEIAKQSLEAAAVGAVIGGGTTTVAGTTHASYEYLISKKQKRINANNQKAIDEARNSNETKLRNIKESSKSPTDSKTNEALRTPEKRQEEINRNFTAAAMESELSQEQVAVKEFEKSEARKKIKTQLQETGKLSEDQVEGALELIDNITAAEKEKNPDTDTEAFYEHWYGQIKTVDPTTKKTIPVERTSGVAMGAEEGEVKSVLPETKKTIPVEKQTAPEYTKEDVKIIEAHRKMRDYKESIANLKESAERYEKQGAVDSAKQLRRAADDDEKKLTRLQKRVDKANISEAAAARIKEEAERLYQGTKEGALNDSLKKGRIENLFKDGVPKIITMFDNADMSTIVHEVGHTILPILERSNDPDINVLLDWVGAKPNTKINDMTDVQHEKVAKGFELYMKEGKAPTEALRNLFERMKIWLTEIYKTISNANYFKNINLTDDVKDTFGRFISADKVVEYRKMFVKMGQDVSPITDEQVLVKGNKVIEEYITKKEKELSFREQILQDMGNPNGPAIVKKRKQKTIYDYVSKTGKKYDKVIILQDKYGNLPDRPLFQNKEANDEIGDISEYEIALNNINSLEKFDEAMSGLGEEYKSKRGEQSRGTVSNVETIALANELGITEQELLERRPGQTMNAHEAVAARMFLHDALVDLVQKAKVLKENERRGIGAPREELQFKKSRTRFYAISAAVMGMREEAGRLLQSFNIGTGSEDLRIKRHLENMNSLPETGMEESKMADILLSRLNEVNDGYQLAEAYKITKAASTATFGENLLALFINNLLWSPLTHARNIGVNLANSGLHIAELTGGAAIDQAKKFIHEKVQHKDTSMNVYLGFDDVKASLMGWVNGWEHAFATMKNVLPSVLKLQGVPEEYRSRVRKIQINKDNMRGKAWELATLPGELLEVEDLFFTKGLLESMALSELAHKEAKIKSKDITMNTGKTFSDSEFIALESDMLTNPAKYGLDVKVEEMTEYLTFRQELGNLGQKVSQLANAQVGNTNVAPLRFIAPFIRTPGNIYKFGTERTPILHMFSGKYRADMAGKNGTAEQSIAQARTIMTYGTATVIWSLASKGLIQGGWHSLSDEEKKWRRSQNQQPYSFKIGNDWYSYQYIAPISIPIAFVANMNEVGHYMNDEDLFKVGSTLFAVIFTGLKDNTFIQGMVEAVNAVTQPDRYGEKYVLRMTENMIPGKAVWKYLRNIFDPNYRDVSTHGADRDSDGSFYKELGVVWNDFRNLFPFTSKGLPKVLNFWGEELKINGSIFWRALSPISTFEDKTDDVEGEFIRLGLNFGMPPKTQKINRVPVELTPDEYNQYIILMNSYGAENKSNLKTMIRDLINSDLYQTPSTTDEYRIRWIKGLIEKARDNARIALYFKNNDIRNFVDNSQK